MTMAINALGLETMTFGPITMPLFAESRRANDIAFSADNPYLQMIQNFRGFLQMLTGAYAGEQYCTVEWANTMYPFVVPAALFGWYKLCRDRRKLALSGSESPLRDGGMLILIWMAASVVNGAVVGTVVNRNNILYYPLILCAAYALWQMGRRLRTALAAMLTMIAVGFVGVCNVYFSDSYQQETGEGFAYGLQEALHKAWGWDCDRYYVTLDGHESNETAMIANVMFAHQIDYAMRAEEEELRGPDGEPNGWYYGERYIYQMFEDFEPDPTECAAYIVSTEETALFDEEDYIVERFGNFAAVYPRYWAE